MDSALPSPRRRWWLGAILLLTFLVYAPALANGFTYDDTRYVGTTSVGSRNVMVETIHPIAEYFAREMGYDGIEATGRGFRPMTVYSYAVLHALSKVPDATQRSGFANRPWLQHAVNVLLHVLATWLVFLMVQRVTGAGLAPLLGALAFGLQPVHSDVVASMVGRGELLPFVFGAVGLLLYVSAVAVSGAPRLLRLVGVFLALFLAFCSKESAIAWCVFLPVFAWALAWVDDPRAGLFSGLWRQRKILWAVALPVAVWAVLYVRFLGLIGSAFLVQYEFNPLYYLPFVERAPVAAMILGYGLAKIFFVTMLACDYGLTVFPTAIGWGDWRFLSALVGLLAILGVGLARARRQPLLFLAVAALLGFSFVTSNILVPIETIFGERLLFTPSLGLCFLVAWLAQHPPSARLGRKLLVGVFALWCLWGARWCVQRSIEWRSNDSLLLADVEHQPRSLSIAKQVAVYWRGRNDEAKWLEYQNRCLALDPHYITVLNDLGEHYMSKREMPRSRAYLDAAVESLGLRPRYEHTHGHVVHLNLGRWYLISGDRPRAKANFQTSNRLNPRSPHARNHLLVMAHEDRDEVVVRTLLADFARYQPRAPEIQLHRGLAAWRRGEYRAALPNLRTALYQHRLGRNGLFLPAWWALEDTLGRLSLFADQVQVLEQMLGAMPSARRGPVRDRLCGALRALLPTAPQSKRALIESRLRELAR